MNPSGVKARRRCRSAPATASVVSGLRTPADQRRKFPIAPAIRHSATRLTVLGVSAHSAHCSYRVLPSVDDRVPMPAAPRQTYKLTFRNLFPTTKNIYYETRFTSNLPKDLRRSVHEP
ncbi:jg26761 [Pararge aegeria aegeria]|uniref:Jg26761 protein n=1 Tax=Pararge aegeria aegeria TaxID=348720 RepID=A0A8S4QLN7_9NEOP|nr:jg26761 [Pararge aegeria aegeria]